MFTRLFSFFSLLFLPFLFLAGTAQGQVSIRRDAPYADGVVRAVATQGDTVFWGGNFSSVGSYTGCGAPLSLATGVPATSFPKLQGTISAVESDGNGGFIVAGTGLKMPNGTAVGLMHLLQDNSVDVNWHLTLTGTVADLHREGTTLYVGGTFSEIGGESRTNLAAVSINSGTVSDWAPNPTYSSNFVTSIVRSIATSGSKVFIGGAFDAVGNVVRVNFAVLNSSSNTPTSWNTIFDFTREVRKLLVSGDHLYVAGGFTVVDDFPTYETRKGICSFTISTETLDAWNPGTTLNPQSAVVTDMVVAGSWVCASISQAQLAFINPATGASFTSQLPSFYDKARSSFYSSTAPTGILGLAATNQTVYVAAAYNVLSSGTVYQHLYALDVNTRSQLTSWSANADLNVNALAISNDKLFAGGDFTSIGRQSRRNLAALNGRTGRLLDWNPGANDTVQALAVSGSTLYAGGAFTTLGSGPRAYAGGVDMRSGNATSFSVVLDGSVKAISPQGGTLYMVGRFTHAGNLARSYAAAASLSNSSVTSWNPSPSSQPNDVLATGSAVYLGGIFSTAGGGTSVAVASVDRTAGQLSTGWQRPSGSGLTVSQLVLKNDTLLALASGVVTAYNAATGQQYDYRIPPSATLIGFTYSMLYADHALYLGYHDGVRIISTATNTEIGSVMATPLPRLAPDSRPYALGLSNNILYEGGFALGLQPQSAASGVTVPAGNLSINVPCASPPPQATLSLAGATTFCQGDSVHLTAQPGYAYAWSNGATTAGITVRESGTYSVQLVTGFCTGIASQSVTVQVRSNPTPVIQASGGLCNAGASVTLTAPQATHYTWSTGDTTASITLTSAATVTLQVRYANGCQSAVSRALTLGNVQLPTPAISTVGQTSGCQGMTVILRGPATGPHYLWSTGDTTNSIQVRATASITLRLVSQGCTSAVSQPVQITISPVPPQASLNDYSFYTCPYDSVTLQVSQTGYRYVWSNGDTTQSIRVAGRERHYTARLKDHACLGPVSTEAVVNNYIVPPVGTITARGNVLTCSSTSTFYTWYRDNVSVYSAAYAQSYTATRSGTYTCYVSNVECGSMSNPFAFTLTGLDDLPTGHLTLAPNPLQGAELRLTAEGIWAAPLRIRLSDAAGRTVLTAPADLSGGQAALTLDALLPNGLYILELQGRAGRRYERLQVQR